MSPCSALILTDQSDCVSFDRNNGNHKILLNPIYLQKSQHQNQITVQKICEETYRTGSVITSYNQQQDLIISSIPRCNKSLDEVYVGVAMLAVLMYDKKMKCWYELCWYCYAQRQNGSDGTLAARSIARTSDVDLVHGCGNAGFADERYRD